MGVELAQVIPALVCANVDFILLGGMAAILRGSARVTFDVDVVYSRTHGKMKRLVAALAPHDPYLRNASRDLSFTWDAKTIRGGLDFDCATMIRGIDVF